MKKIKNANKPKFWYYISAYARIGSVAPIDQQIKLVSPKLSLCLQSGEYFDLSIEPSFSWVLDFWTNKYLENFNFHAILLLSLFVVQ